MPVKKVTFVFDGRQCGWTESYYLESGEDHKKVMELAKDIATPRARLLGAEASIKAIRISTEGVDNDGMLEYTPDLRGNLQKPCAQRDVCLMVRCENAGHNAWRNMFMRGIWDEVEDEQGRYIGRKNKAWREAFDSYQLLVCDRGWGWMHASRGHLGKVKSLAKGESVPEAAGEDTLVYTLHNPAFAAGDVTDRKQIQVRVTGINGKSTANGLKVVQIIAPDKFETVKPLAAGKYRHGGFVVGYTYTLADIATMHDAKVVSRETGAPLLESAGRAREKPRA